MRGRQPPPRRFTNGYRIIVLRLRDFMITLNLSDRRYSDPDYAAPAQLYRGNLPHYHWLGRRVQPVRTLLVIKTTLRSPRPLNAPYSRKVSPPKRTNGSKNGCRRQCPKVETWEDLIGASWLPRDYFFTPRTASFAALATRNLTTVLAGILIFCRVFGLKPERAFLFCFTSLPNPGKTNSPFFLVAL